MPSDPYITARDALIDGANLRVWSMIATVFGDLALQRGDVIEGPVLSTLMAEMRIRPEATRVALHRLRENDGWIVSTKRGRLSQHRLSQKGRAESETAARRIYRAPQEDTGGWRLVLTESQAMPSREEMAQRGFVPLMPRIYVGAADQMAPKDTLCLDAQHAPSWLGAQLEPKGLSQDYTLLHDRLGRAAGVLSEDPELTPLQTATLRRLIVHGWRRLVLRHPPLPAALYTPAWRGHDCQALVFRLLASLPRPELSALHP